MPELFLSLLMFSIVATISPGGATTLATASGAQFGFTRSIPLIAGIAVGLASLVGAAALGLGVVTRAVPHLELLLRIVGSAYLLWLASVIGRQAGPANGSAKRTAPIGFLVGLALLWANPKAWTMAVAAAGTYSSLLNNPIALAAVLAAIFGLSATVSLSIWCKGGDWLARSIRSHRGWRVLNLTLALLLVLSIVSMWA